ncbi:MAG TPA: Spy/CpxP family protein refolding chaperone [Opitutaceae bacterium]|nr:Spy/CpxP family protein refolding chaperone [Opitutaceae bacterium]
MNTTLKTLLTLISLALCPALPVVRGADTPAPAPTAPAPAKPHSAFARLQEQLQTLNLTDDQKAKLDAIIQDAEKATADLKKDKGAAKEDRQAERQTLRQATLDKIHAVLTPEQAAKFAKHGKGKGKAKADDKAEDKPEDTSAL